MIILDQLQNELVTAAYRPSPKARILVRALTVVVAAILALLIAAPPSCGAPHQASSSVGESQHALIHVLGSRGWL